MAERVLAVLDTFHRRLAQEMQTCRAYSAAEEEVGRLSQAERQRIYLVLSEIESRIATTMAYADEREREVS